MSYDHTQLTHSSQTAPIQEYRVMWTAQKKQKLKKWHDGTLRFHTFNNRMLLYDEARSLITDKYLKPGIRIDEGDELEFEQHLVTVEEFLQTVIQDLAPVFAPAMQRARERASTAIPTKAADPTDSYTSDAADSSDPAADGYGAPSATTAASTISCCNPCAGPSNLGTSTSAEFTTSTTVLWASYSESTSSSSTPGAGITSSFTSSTAGVQTWGTDHHHIRKHNSNQLHPCKSSSALHHSSNRPLQVFKERHNGVHPKHCAPLVQPPDQYQSTNPPLQADGVPEPRKSDTPEPGILRLSDPHKKRRKMLAPPPPRATPPQQQKEMQKGAQWPSSSKPQPQPQPWKQRPLPPARPQPEPELQPREQEQPPLGMQAPQPQPQLHKQQQKQKQPPKQKPRAKPPSLPPLPDSPPPAQPQRSPISIDIDSPPPAQPIPQPNPKPKPKPQRKPPTHSEPPPKRARATATTATAAAIDSDSDSDPFCPIATPVVKAKARKQPEQPEQPVQADGRPAEEREERKTLAQLQAERKDYGDTGAWSREARDLFEWKPW
ncbi:hypothetical protein BZA05DRAFT_434020 [Tricharina praecox]|uniref:uncharacterized protein n=1 Tax=Tricharina praecox TaxID=43433 RepID=UPI00221FFC66|nr:uncharacterized protein BZA05DRAFT_434020 [Tricharina praecox]KAI5856444.1 hypothetical protein BZA05DRAFT_434020 [Tricharina praecox]